MFIEDRQLRILDSNIRNSEFMKKWEHRLATTNANGDKIYGPYIDIIDAPRDWFDIIDTYLEEIKAKYPDFQIFQLKMKFGTIRIYLENVPYDVKVGTHVMSKRLTDPRLIY